MRILFRALVALTILALTAVTKADDAWLTTIRPTHPRMFFNEETWPAVKAYAQKNEAAYYAKIKKRVAALPEKPDTAANEKGTQITYGPNAMMAAFVWRVEQDKSALEKSRSLILAALKFYTKKSAAGEAVNWYSADRVQTLAAYDWIYDQLAPAERTEIAKAFFKHIHDDDTVKRVGSHNRGDYKTGFYGAANLPWYIGLAFHKDGIDDDNAAALIKRGYADHIQHLEYRAESAGDDGGIGSLAVGYGLGFYPWSEFNFMHTYQSATGKNLADRFDHLSLLPNWVYWNRLPGNMTWGLADSVPPTKFGSAFLEMHMLQIAHFYAKRFPERARFALWIRQNILEEKDHDDYWWPVAPLLLPNCATLPEPAGPDKSWPLARNFEQMGLITMRSDWTDDAVCAAFVAGGKINQHRHYDQGHFILYRKDHLALDSGDYGPRERNDHLTEYSYRTVAHNAILIDAPADADTAAQVWGGKGKTLDGGQSEFAGKQLAFETNADFTYAATDATACYDAKKCKLATRQFVFLYPDTFIICDRITSTKPEYAKHFLLHMQNEPTITGSTMRTETDHSAMICQTIFPENITLEKIGGPGKEFWSAGSNHPQEGKFEKPKKLSGAWRIEVTPKEKSESTTFLHIIRLGDKSMKTIGPIEPLKTETTVGLKINNTTLTFNTTGPTAAHIKTEKIDRPLTTELQPQSGLAKQNP